MRTKNLIFRFIRVTKIVILSSVVYKFPSLVQWVRWVGMGAVCGVEEVLYQRANDVSKESRFRDTGKRKKRKGRRVICQNNSILIVYFNKLQTKTRM